MTRFRAWCSAATTLRRLHGWLALISLAAMPIAYATGLDKHTRFISQISLLALAFAEGGAWQATRVEVQVTENATLDV